jgi:hypothetical protein
MYAVRSRAETDSGWKATMTSIRDVGNRHILPAVLAGLARNAVNDPGGARHRLIKDIFIACKRFSARNVLSIQVSDIAGIEHVHVCGDVIRKACGSQFDPFILTALCQVARCEAIFEIGTYVGETAWLLAHNNENARIFTLDLPDLQAASRTKFRPTDPCYFVDWNRTMRFSGSPEESRIVQLYGDSATFDFSPFYGKMDLVFIDASHSHSYVKSDTESALKMVSDHGIIVWDDYTHYPGIYAYLNELSPSLDRPIMHILDTRLAVYSRRDLCQPASKEHGGVGVFPAHWREPCRRNRALTSPVRPARRPVA